MKDYFNSRPINRNELPANLFESVNSPTIYPDFPDEYVIKLSHSDYMLIFRILEDFEDDLLSRINNQVIEQFVEYRRHIKENGGFFESEAQSDK